MKNIEFYYEEILKKRSYDDVHEFALEKGMDMKLKTSVCQDLIIWLNEDHQFLDETEKRYLGNIIRPLRTKYTTIEKNEHVDEYGRYEYITIHNLVDHANGAVSLRLPMFKAGIMYKGMEKYKVYHLEELGLWMLMKLVTA